MADSVPEGYTYLNLPANPFDNSCRVYVCDGCGSMVGNTSIHDEKHKNGF